MKKILLQLVIANLLFCYQLAAQQNKGNKLQKNSLSSSAKKYPSLLWEISGNGLSRASYLFGTMHVSDKLVFHLGDSFYNAIKSTEVVALETNPETWQDDYSKSVFFKNPTTGLDPYRLMEAYPIDNLTINSFAIDTYTEILKAALAVEPSMINGMLYRTYGTQMDDFEEDTFLDMYLFQVGKKLGKRVTGVENFHESEKLVMEAYRDMIRDQHKKRRSYDFEGMMNNPKKIEDAYRTGDLDLLDSLENLSTFSDAFQEKFLYKRNQIQAGSIDSIIRRSSLFVGVGAAHLPGPRGVIELLRQKGYRLRPVNMDERNSLQKETIDKIRLPLNFQSQTAADGFYKVSIPGDKLYRFTNWSGMDIVQFADMVNGTYYMVNRIKTNALLFGDNPDIVQKKIDSLLYENVPGKILRKTSIAKNGYKGFDITNRTRRGDHQRYQIFVTPFEVIIFKMSGNGDYVSTGEETQKFFSSIQLRELPRLNSQNWQPATGGFIVQLPHPPFLYRDKDYGTDRLEYIASDKENDITYLLVKANLHNYTYFAEDTFELNLLDESYSFSPFIDKELSHQFSKVNGYPALACKYRHKDGSYSMARYIIQGPIYYALITRYKNEGPGVQKFFDSFTITPFKYPGAKETVDSSLHFRVSCPPFEKAKDEEEEAITRMQDLIRLAYKGEDEEEPWLSSYSFPEKTKFFGNDTIGEKIFVTYSRLSDYDFIKDSSRLWEEADDNNFRLDTSFIYREKKEYTLPNGFRCREIQLSDTASSKLLILKSFYKNGHFFSLSTLTDTLTKKSSFIEEFFNSFRPADTLRGTRLFVRQTGKFFSDFFNKDSLRAKAARKAVYQLRFDSVDVPLLIRGIDSLNWTVKNYLAVKKYWIAQLGGIDHPAALPYLKSLYLKVKDTAELQYAILNALLRQKTKSSFSAFKDLMLLEPPIIEEQGWSSYPPGKKNYIINMIPNKNRHHYGQWAELYDTLSLTSFIFPDFLQLMTLDDYKDEVMNLLTSLVDSGYLKAGDYENYFSKIYLDAKQLLKKQVAKEEKDKIEKASNKDRIAGIYSPDVDNEDQDEGNNELQKYAVLLLPFWDRNPGIPIFFQQLLKTESRKLLYQAFLLMFRNNKPVPDSLFQKFAKLDEYRSDLYGDLKKINKQDKFPLAYKKQELIARSLLISSSDYYGKLDTLVFLDKLPVTYRNKNGYVYFFKYKRMKDDASWQLASVGMQPEDLHEVNIENNEFTEMERRKLETDKPVEEQLQKMLKELLYSKRPAGSGFYDGRSASMYRSFLPDMVKSSRYRD